MSNEIPPNETNSDIPLESVISRAVEMGYKVIEEQIHLGQRMAERVSDGNISSGDVSGSTTEVVERLRVFYSDLGALWFEMLESVFRNHSLGEWLANINPQGNAPHGYPANGAAPAAATNGHATLPIEIVSTEATGARAILEIHAHPTVGSLIATPLHSRDRSIPPITDIQFIEAVDGWPASLRVSIPGGQSAGTYSGLVFNSVNDEPAGTLCVQIPDRA